MKIKYSIDINCNKCGSNNTVFVYDAKREKTRPFRTIFLRCLDCKKERDLTHTEGSSYAIWQMDNKNWSNELVRE
jgi:transposase-like protein